MKIRHAIAMSAACCAFAAQAAAPAEQTISAARLIDAARAALPATPQGLTLTTQVLGAPADAVVQAGVITLHADAPTTRWPRSRVAVPVVIRINGKDVRTETVWFSVHALRNSLVYDSDAPAATPLEKLRTHMAQVDVAGVDETLVDETSELANQRLKRGVHAGWPVLKEDFSPIPDVDRQSRVVVHVRYGSIQMETLATALAAGDIGDTVPVLVEGAESPVPAQVEAKGVVDIAR